MGTPVILLHGFAGTPRHWDRVIAELPRGRYEADTPSLTDADPLTPDGVAALVAGRAAAERAILVGYSMGGRLALHTALAIPDRIARLVLISASAGIEDRAEREARQAADEALAGEIEGHSIEWFVSRWSRLPLFASDPDWIAAEVAADERGRTPGELAAMLRGLGAGAMAPMWDRLASLPMPVAVLTGELDAAYALAGRRMAACISASTFLALPGVGHRVALQAAGEVARAIQGPE